VSYTKRFDKALAAIEPAVADPFDADGSGLSAGLAYRHNKIMKDLHDEVRLRAIHLVQAGWPRSWDALLVRAAADPAARREYAGGVPDAEDVARWRDQCATVGPALLGWPAIEAALSGAYDAPLLAELALVLPYAGATGAGAHHFHPGCPPLDVHRVPVADPQATATTLGSLSADVPRSRRHGCVADLSAWLPARVRAELALFADAVLLTAPWRAALAVTAAGRQGVPADRVPLTSGLLDDLATLAAQAAGMCPSRPHLGALAAQLRAVVEDWSDFDDAFARAEVLRIAAEADPQVMLEAWQERFELPELEGSERQVAWAERIRYALAAPGDPYVMQVATAETSAPAWIGLRDSAPEDVFQEWTAMRARAWTREEHAGRPAQMRPVR